MWDQETSRKNSRFGLLLFGLFLLISIGTVGVALLYAALD
jgi:hypothetical protein